MSTATENNHKLFVLK